MMNLPAYLGKALQSGIRVRDLTLTHHHVGELFLPTGQLVACDPLISPDAEPFALPLPTGTFPVTLSVAAFPGGDQRVAFSIVRFRENSPATWEMMTVGQQDLSTLAEDEVFGYPVDTGTGCFMDRSTGRALDARMREDNAFFEVIVAEKRKTYRHTWSWLDMSVGDGNLIAFSSGCGDGFYATYAGFDAEGEVAVVVTDFDILPLEEDGAETAKIVGAGQKS